jgi:hypothetical protein
MRKLRLAGKLICFLLLATILSGCAALSTRKGFYEPIVGDLQSGKYQEAVARIEDAHKEHKYAFKDRFLYYLDAGLAYHYASDFDSSNQRLSNAEQTAGDLFTKSISKAAVSLLLNDNVLDYAGEDYEVLYTNLFMALNYLELNQFDDAFVEIRRANLKLDLLEQKYAEAASELQKGSDEDSNNVQIDYHAANVRFNNSALARYLSMHMYAADGDWDDARVDYDYLHGAFATQPNVYPFPIPDVKYSSDSGSILSIVALVGLSPVKEPLNLRLRTDKQLDLVQILYDGPGKEDVVYGQFGLPVNADYYFKFAIPVIESRPSEVSTVRVWSGDELLGELQLLEDISSVARETFEAKKSLIYLRSVARAVIKGLSTHQLKKKVDNGDVGGWLAKAAIDVGTDVTENADLRCSRLLPGKVMVGDFAVPPGTYDLTIEFLAIDGSVLYTREFGDYSVYDRGLNLLEAVYLN